MSYLDVNKKLTEITIPEIYDIGIYPTVKRGVKCRTMNFNLQ